jgi:DNA polymerase-3 subunit gamma/tau
MAYISLYRKYRPQTFEDVVGQEHVTTTLRNSVQEGRVANGYLFTGTRGTAKTTCARILAKALNCIGADGSLTAPTPNPCGVCGPCRSIASSSFVDVLEMDAASHGKVDDVRDLVASIKFPPMEGRYKVYIIDEAHQLSSDAKDAFLKTLEEPPDRVVFILATTEIDKLPITIASRCQVYEFKRGSVAQISSRIADVLAAEGIQADPGAVTLIARAADGSYRDSLSLLEQVLAYQREHVTSKDVTVVLGTIDDDLLSQVVDLIADSDAAGAFTLAGSILESGKDVRQFLKSLAERFRNMLFVGVGASPSAAGEMDDSAGMRAQAARFAPAALLQALETLTAAEQETKRSNQHRLLLEMALLRLMRLPSHSVAAPQVVANGNGVKAVVPPPVAVVTPHTAPLLPAPMPPKPEPPKPEPPKAEPAIVVPYDMPPPLAEDELPDEESVLTEEDGLLGGDAPQPGDDDLDSLPFDDDEEDDEEDEEAPSLIIVSAEAHEEADDLLHVQQVAMEAPAFAPPKPAPLPDTPPELLRLQKSWQEVVNRLSAKPSTAAIIRDAEPVALMGQKVWLQFSGQFNVDRVEGNEKGRAVLEEAINKTLGVEAGTYQVKAILKGQPLPARATTSRPEGKVESIAQSVQPKPREQALPVAPSDAPGPFVEKVIAVFGGQLLDDEVKG